MLSEIKTAILIAVILTLVTGLLYPLAITCLAQVLFPAQANGSLITANRHANRFHRNMASLGDASPARSGGGD